jgi:hypothetical protein
LDKINSWKWFFIHFLFMLYLFIKKIVTANWDAIQKYTRQCAKGRDNLIVFYIDTLDNKYIYKSEEALINSKNIKIIFLHIVGLLDW